MPLVIEGGVIAGVTVPETVVTPCVVALQGPPGTGVPAYTHVQALASTVWTVNHALGYDPAGIVVFDAFGVVMDGFGVQYLTPGVSLRLSFDISFSGTARLS